MDAGHDYVCPVALNIDTVDLGDLTKHLVAAAAPQFPRLQVQAEVDPRAPRIQGDARRLAQVGNLLLSNACQAAQKRVTFTARSSPSGEAEWIVTDDGPGIPEDQKPRLFTLSTATRHGHLGVGPALAQKIVLQHGGRISADNVAGGGFQVKVALLQESAAAQK